MLDKYCPRNKCNNIIVILGQFHARDTISQRNTNAVKMPRMRVTLSCKLTWLETFQVISKPAFSQKFGHTLTFNGFSYTWNNTVHKKVLNKAEQDLHLRFFKAANFGFDDSIAHSWDSLNQLHKTSHLGWFSIKRRAWFRMNSWNLLY